MTQTQVAPPENEMVRRKVSDLKPHPKNPRKASKASIEEMAKSLEQHGLMQPLCINQNNEILAGERRWRAAKVLGWDEINCVVKHEKVSDALSEGDDVMALLAAQETIEDHDPFMQAEQIEALLKAGLPINRVADRIGKSMKWVAQRRVLRTISPKVRKAYEDGVGFAGWDADMLAAFCALSAEDQDALIPKRGMWSPLEDLATLEDVEAFVAQKTHLLGKAQWKLDDAELYPKAGPCTTCPMQSLMQPGLFDDGQSANIKEARCLSVACWSKKTEELALRKAQALGPNTKILVDDSRALPELYGAGRTEWKTSYAEGEGEKAVYVTAGGVVKTISIQVSKASKASKAKPSKGKATEDEMSPDVRYAESVQQIERRRKACVVDNVSEVIQGLENVKDAGVLMRLVAAYGVLPPTNAYSSEERMSLIDRLMDNQTWCTIVWPRVIEYIRRDLNRVNPSSLNAQYEIAKWLSRELQLTWAVFERTAEESVPEPKWWAAYHKRLAVKPAKPEKAVKPVKGKKAKK